MTFNDVSADQLVAMGDGLLARGESSTARQVYSLALKQCAPKDRQRIRTRLGLASAPSRRTPFMLDVAHGIENLNMSGPFVGEGLATWLKTLPFADDARFLALAERHAHLLPLANWHWNLQTALWAAKEARNVPGDYVELGVFKGHTTLFCAEYIDFQDMPKTWWLYDTFEGIPADQQAEGWAERNADLYQHTFSYEEVAARFAHIPNIKVIKGRVPEILHQGAPDRIAFMHIDMNNAPAEIAALDHLFERVSPGGVILFDDYGWATARAQYDAENRWFAERGLQILALPTGQGVFMKR